MCFNINFFPLKIRRPYIFHLCIQCAALVAELHQMNVENQRLKELVDKLRIDCNALEEHVVQLKQKQYKQEVVLFFSFF
jgi:hypothetical protein